MGLRRCFGTLAAFIMGIFYVHLFFLLRNVDIQKTEDLFFFGRQAPDSAKRSIFSIDTSVGETEIYDIHNNTNTSNRVLDDGHKPNIEALKKSVEKTKEEIRDVSVKKEHGAKEKATPCFKKVLLWARYAGELGFSHGQHDISCAGSVCDVRLTVDTSFDAMQQNEALILYHWSNWNWDDMHAHRPAGQKWVFYTLESPRHTRNHVVPPVKYYNNTYDYIMTFRYDSDFRADYGQYIDGKPEIAANDSRNWAKGRTKIVAWMASNCNGPSWPRTQFVKNLQKYIPVGTYGKCGAEKCQPGSKACDNTLAQYKFYLALENSECTDYITEKFWIQSLVRGLVPIVFGPPRSDYEKVAPPGSFIHVQDFSTTKELADFLKRVDSDDALYSKFFEWKKKGSLKPYGKGPNIMCQLGDRLVQDQEAAKKGVVTGLIKRNWEKWWSKSCKSSGKIPID